MTAPNQQASDWYLSVDSNPLVERIQTPTGWKIVDGLQEHLVDKDDPNIPTSWKHITRPESAGPYLKKPLADLSSPGPWPTFSSSKDILEQATPEPSNLEIASGEYREPTGYNFNQLQEDWSGSYLGKKGTNLWKTLKKVPSAFAKIGSFGTELDSAFERRYGTSPNIGDKPVDREVKSMGEVIASVGDAVVSGIDAWNERVAMDVPRPDYSYERSWLKGGPAGLFSKAGSGANTSGYEYLIGYIKESYKLEQDLINQKDLLEKSGIDPMTDQDFSFTKEKLDGIYNKIHTMSDNIKKWRQGYSLSIYDYINIESDKVRTDLANLRLEEEPKPSIHHVGDPVEKIDIINKDNLNTIENALAVEVIENTGSIPVGAYDSYYFTPLNAKKWDDIKQPIDEIRESQDRLFTVKNSFTNKINQYHSYNLYRQSDPYIIGTTRQAVAALVKQEDLSLQDQGILLQTIVSNLDILTTRLDSSYEKAETWQTENSTEELLKFAFRDAGSSSEEIMINLKDMVDDLDLSLNRLYQEKADPVRSLENFALDMMIENVNPDLKTVKDMHSYVGSLIAEGSKTGRYTHEEVVRGLEVYNSVMKNASKFMNEKRGNAEIESDILELNHFSSISNSDGTLPPVKNSVSPSNYFIRNKNHRAHPDQAAELLAKQQWFVFQDFTKVFRDLTAGHIDFAELSDSEMESLSWNAISNILIDKDTGELDTRSLYIPYYGTAAILSTVIRNKTWAPEEGMHPALEVMGKSLMDVILSVGNRKGETIDNPIVQRDLHNRYYSSLYTVNELIKSAEDISTGVSHNTVQKMLGIDELTYIALQGWLGNLEATEFIASGEGTGSSMLSAWATYSSKELYDWKTGETLEPNLEAMGPLQLAIHNALFSPELLADIFGDTTHANLLRDNFLAIASEQYDASNLTDGARQILENLPDLPKTLIEAEMAYIKDDEFNEKKFLNDMRPYHGWVDMLDSNTLLNFMENNRQLIDLGQYAEYKSMALQYPELVQLAIIGDHARQPGNELMMQHIIGSYSARNRGDLMSFDSLIKIVTSSPANRGNKLINGRPVPNDYVQLVLDHSVGSTRRDNLTGETGVASTNFGNATAKVDNDIGFWGRIWNHVNAKGKGPLSSDAVIPIPDHLKPLLRERIQYTTVTGETHYNNINYGAQLTAEDLAVVEQLHSNIIIMANNASTIQWNTGFQSLDAMGNLGTSRVVNDMFMLLQEQMNEDPSGQLNNLLVENFTNKDMIGNAFFDWVMVNAETRPNGKGGTELYSPILAELEWEIEDLFPIPITVALEDNEKIKKLQTLVNNFEEDNKNYADIVPIGEEHWFIKLTSGIGHERRAKEIQYLNAKKALKTLTSKEGLRSRYLKTGETDWKYADEDLYVFPFIDFKFEWGTIKDPVTGRSKDVLMMFIGGKEVSGPNGIPTRKWLKLGTAPGGDNYKTPTQGTVSAKYKANRKNTGIPAIGHGDPDIQVQTSYDLGQDWADPTQQITRSIYPRTRESEPSVKDIPRSAEALANEFARDYQWINDMRDSELLKVRSSERWSSLNKRQQQEIEGDILRQAALDRQQVTRNFSTMMTDMNWTLPEGYLDSFEVFSKPLAQRNTKEND